MLCYCQIGRQLQITFSITRFFLLGYVPSVLSASGLLSGRCAWPLFGSFVFYICWSSSSNTPHSISEPSWPLRDCFMAIYTSFSSLIFLRWNRGLELHTGHWVEFGNAGTDDITQEYTTIQHQHHHTELQSFGFYPILRHFAKTVGSILIHNPSLICLLQGYGVRRSSLKLLRRSSQGFGIYVDSRMENM